MVPIHLSGSSESRKVCWNQNVVTKITDAIGNIYLIERDLDGRPTKITRPDNSYSLFTYDPVYHDLVMKFDSATNVTLNYQFDNLGNLLTQNLPSGDSVAYTYDPNTGLLLTKTPRFLPLMRKGSYIKLALSLI